LNDRILKQHLRKLLSGHGAHVGWSTALQGLPKRLRGEKPRGFPHSPWDLVEHARIAQRDILEFCRDRKHVSPDWPSGYWPKRSSPRNAAEWSLSLKGFQHDLKSMLKLVTNPGTDLEAPIRHGSGETILREALLLADHNSYHVGQFVLLRRLLGSWPET
jgi:DinB superfamily